jgi:hypothetical protein
MERLVAFTVYSATACLLLITVNKQLLVKPSESHLQPTRPQASKHAKRSSHRTRLSPRYCEVVVVMARRLGGESGGLALKPK